MNSATPLSSPREFGTDLSQTFTVSDKDLSVSGVPVAYPALSVDFPGDLSYDRDLEMLQSDDRMIEAGTSYTVRSTLVQPTPEALRAENLSDPLANTRYTVIPAGLEELHTIALDWTAEATTDYERILAIQDRFQSTEFHYDANVPPRDDRFTLLDFVQETKAGFCQQFASAMAVMLRTLGYPTRVAVGFTQGQRSDTDGRWHVTTKNAHA